jgi:hypothetical protein
MLHFIKYNKYNLNLNLNILSEFSDQTWSFIRHDTTFSVVVSADEGPSLVRKFAQYAYDLF